MNRNINDFPVDWDRICKHYPDLNALVKMMREDLNRYTETKNGVVWEFEKYLINSQLPNADQVLDNIIKKLKES